MPYAARTKVPTNKTRMDIEALLAKHKAKRFAVMVEEGGAGAVMFDMQDRRLRFRVVLPNDEQGMRQRWRALLLVIKAKLEAVESKIETFEEAFLAHVVLPDGKTVAEHAIPAIAAAYAGKDMPPLIPHHP